MNLEQKTELENKLMRSLPFAIAGLFCFYLYLLYDGLVKGVFWVEGWSIMVRMNPISSGYISQINMIAFLMLLIGIVMIVIWADQHGFLDRL